MILKPRLRVLTVDLSCKDVYLTQGCLESAIWRGLQASELETGHETLDGQASAFEAAGEDSKTLGTFSRQHCGMKLIRASQQSRLAG